MINKLIKKIWFICLWLASLALAGCFHVPDEDWLLSNNNKAETWDVKNDEMDEALNSLMDWFDIISSGWNNVKNDESDGINTDDWNENTIEVEDNTISNEEIIDNEETTDNEVENGEIEENITPEE
jgi:hypothetical protein